MASEARRYLDPLADKVLIVSIYVSLGIAAALPRWLVILVVSRDLLIVGGVMFSWLIGRPVSVKPHPVSKLNTAAQLLLVGLVLGALRLGFDAGWALIWPWRRSRRCRSPRSRCTCANGCATGRRRDTSSIRIGAPALTLTRQMTFWVLTFVVGVVTLWILREILLPFVAGMALAYLLDPLASRLERMGVNRLVATLVLIGAVVLRLRGPAAAVRADPAAQLGAFFENFPGYVSKLQSLVSESTRDWLRSIFGDNVTDAQVGDLVKRGAGWAGTFAKSLWSGGQALRSRSSRSRS